MATIPTDQTTLPLEILDLDAERRGLDSRDRAITLLEVPPRRGAHSLFSKESS